MPRQRCLLTKYIHNKLGIGISPIPSGTDDDRSQRFTRQNDLHPVTWCLIVAIDLAAILWRPFEIRSNVVVRRVLQLLLIHVDHIAALLFIVLQCPPWQWVVFLAHAEKTTEGHDCVDRSTTNLIDQDVVNCAEIFSRQIIDIRSVNLFGCNERPCLLYTSDAADDLLCVDLGGR